MKSYKQIRHLKSATAPEHPTEVPLLLDSIEEGNDGGGMSAAAAEAVAAVPQSTANGSGAARPRSGAALWGVARQKMPEVQRLRSPLDENRPLAVRNEIMGGSLQHHRSVSLVEQFMFKLGDSRRKSSGRTIASSAVGVGSLPGGSEEESQPPIGKWAPVSDARHMWHMIYSSYLNVLLLAIPIAIFAGITEMSPVLVFWSSFLALLPLALILGEITEDLAVRFGDAIGGLLNATFGNIVEMILSMAALSKGLYEVVAASLIGSILSNLLLVLGCCFLFGGLKYKHQTFNSMQNKVSSSLLFLSSISIIIPTAARSIYGGDVMTDVALINLSHAIALCLIGMYVCYLYFQLKTHADSLGSSPSTAYLNGDAAIDDDEGDGGDGDEPHLSLYGALLTLSLITATVAVCSEFLTGALEAVAKSSGINPVFLGLIVLPIAGNAAEHITAVFVAVKNKMDLAISVALGSSIQVATFVLPVTVLAGWIIGHELTLDFDPFAVLMMTVSVILAYFVSSDGSSNWILGLQLVVTYFLIGAVFFVERENGASDGGSDGVNVHSM